MMNGHPPAYIQAAVDGEVARLASAQHGERNQNLFKSTAALASLGLSEGEILRHLRPVAETLGLRGGEFYSTIKSGIKAGKGKPRPVPNYCAQGVHPATAAEKPAFIPRGDEGPRKASDELRRHVYRREGRAVRIKIKRCSGYVNWYRVVRDSVDGWQAGKPAGYQACPYFGAINPFDAELGGELLYWPEGEKDCDTLGNAALLALTFGGTGDGLPDGAADYLHDRHVVILADNDIGGREHAAKKAALAHTVAASIRLLEFPELLPKGDVTDYLRTASAEDLEQRARETPLWTPQSLPAEHTAPTASWQDAIILADKLKDKVFAPVRYVLPGYIPEGVAVFAGKPKIGKSWLLFDICFASSSGRFVLGDIKPAEGNVLYLALEDSQRRLQRRLEKLSPQQKTWPDRLALATDWRRADAGGIQDIADWCDSVPRPVLVVIDTLERFRQLAKPGSSAYTTDYVAIAGLHKLAHERGIAIVVIHHVRKMEADDPFDMVSGTNGLTGAADTILVLKRQSGNVTLYARGRDIEEKETACQFDKSSCRWTLLGEAVQVHNSGQRAAVLEAVCGAGAEGMTISEIMVATGRRDRNALDQLLYKMARDGDLTRVKRGVYAAGKTGKKERNEDQPVET